MRNRSFFTLLYVAGTYARLAYIWYEYILCMISVLIVFHAANQKKEYGLAATVISTNPDPYSE